jgi:hypothetical protein
VAIPDASKTIVFLPQPPRRPEPEEICSVRYIGRGCSWRSSRNSRRTNIQLRYRRQQRRCPPIHRSLYRILHPLMRPRGEDGTSSKSSCKQEHREEEKIRTGRGRSLLQKRLSKKRHRARTQEKIRLLHAWLTNRRAREDDHRGVSCLPDAKQNQAAGALCPLFSRGRAA